MIDAGEERVLVRIGGQFSGADSLEDINLRVGDRFFRLTDVADIRRSYEDPPSALFRYRGEAAVGLAVGMRQGANIVDFGEELDDVLAKAQAELPVGVEIHLVADQPHVVEEAVGHFLQALLEAVLIVLAVSKRSGRLLANPSGDTAIEVGDLLIVIGTRKQLAAFEDLCEGGGSSE